MLPITHRSVSLFPHTKPDRAWDEWVDRANLPLRACVGVALEKDDLVGPIVTAALDAEAAR
jgi:hypothetical protein